MLFCVAVPNNRDASCVKSHAACAVNSLAVVDESRNQDVKSRDWLEPSRADLEEVEILVKRFWRLLYHFIRVGVCSVVLQCSAAQPRRVMRRAARTPLASERVISMLEERFTYLLAAMQEILNY